ncbi:MAG: hypothetical protein ABJ281_08580 [Lentilitoribacter sp.]
MQFSDITEYEMNEDGWFWIPESRFESTKFKIFRDDFFLPENFIYLFDLFDLFGQNIFGDNWTFNERYSFHTVKPIMGIDYLYQRLFHGDWNFETRDIQGSTKMEYLVKPLSEEKYEQVGAAYSRMRIVLEEVRKKLYDGQITAFQNPEDPSEISRTAWAGSLWDVLIYKSTLDIASSGIEYHDYWRDVPTRPNVYFSEKSVTALLSKTSNTAQNPNNPLKEIIPLSPYIQFARKIAAELKITQDYTPKKTTVAEHISENWPADCGDKSEHKINMIASMVRWPNHEIGGNTKSKPPKG